MTFYVSAQFPYPEFLNVLFVSHSQPLDHVSSCSETWRIWVGKYSHVWPSFFCFSPADVYFSVLSSPILSHLTFLPFLLICFILPLAVTMWPRRKPQVAKNDSIGQRETSQLAYVGDEEKCTYVPKNAHTHRVHAHTQPKVSQKWFNLAALPAVVHSLFMCDVFRKCSRCLMLCREVYCSCLFLH